MSENSPQSKEELPKIGNPLKEELIGGTHRLKHTETQEKIVLPSKEDLVQERTQTELLKSIEDFEKDTSLNKTVCHERNVLPTKEAIEAEKQLN